MGQRERGKRASGQESSPEEPESVCMCVCACMYMYVCMYVGRRLLCVCVCVCMWEDELCVVCVYACKKMSRQRKPGFAKVLGKALL